jgi:hypothetical protein
MGMRYLVNRPGGDTIQAYGDYIEQRDRLKDETRNSQSGMN